MPSEISILNPIIIPRVVQEFDGSEMNLLGRSLCSIESDIQPFWEYDIEIVDRDKLESYQAPNTEARLLDHLPYGHMQGAYAYSRIKKMFSPTTLRLLRAVGEGSASSAAGERYVMRELQDMRDKMMRQEEYAIWQMIQGKWTFQVESGNSYTIDYKIPAANNVTVTTSWGASGDDPVGDLNALKRVIMHNTGHSLTNAYMNTKTMQKFYNLPEVTEFLSETQKQIYTTERTVRRWNGIDWMEYDNGYVSGDTYHTYIPDDKIIFLVRGGSNPLMFKYGPSLDHEAPPGWTGVFTKSWLEPDPSNRQVLMEVQYMPILLQPTKIAMLDITA